MRHGTLLPHFPTVGSWLQPTPDKPPYGMWHAQRYERLAQKVKKATLAEFALSNKLFACSAGRVATRLQDA
jgi:hypothetical protein